MTRPGAASGSGASERDDGGRGAAPVTDEVVETSTEPLLGAPERQGNGSGSAADGVGPSQPTNEKTVARGVKKGINRTVIEWVVLVVAAIIIAIVIKSFLFQAFYIPSRSMVPTLEVGDRVLVNKLSYDLHDVNRGDIVVFEAEPNADWRRAGIDDLVKRIIALPGETVTQCQPNRICVDGRLLERELPPERHDHRPVPRHRRRREPTGGHHARLRGRQPEGWLQGAGRRVLRDGRQPQRVVGRARPRADQGLEHRRAACSCASGRPTASASCNRVAAHSLHSATVATIRST